MQNSNLPLRTGMNSGVLVAGFGFGLIVGAIIGLSKSPLSGKEFRNLIISRVSGTGLQVRKGIETLVSSDTVAESIAEGKAAAAHRRAELNT